MTFKNEKEKNKSVCEFSVAERQAEHRKKSKERRLLYRGIQLLNVCFMSLYIYNNPHSPKHDFEVLM